MNFVKLAGIAACKVGELIDPGSIVVLPFVQNIPTLLNLHAGSTIHS